VVRESRPIADAVSPAAEALKNLKLRLAYVQYSTSIGYQAGKLWTLRIEGEPPILEMFDWQNPAVHARLPLRLKLPEPVQQRLLAARGSQSEAKENETWNYSLVGLQMIPTTHGLLFWRPGMPGFWFVPQKEVQSALELAGELPKPR
jgi:hypothetical protein